MGSSKEILLVTLNATYQHASFGLRYLYANLKELQSRATIYEATINQEVRDIVEEILSYRPTIVGFGVYIWNTTETEQVVGMLRRIAPDLIIVLGGPEVSHETEVQPLTKFAHYVIKGEADFLFYDFCHGILIRQTLPGNKIISGPLPEVSLIHSPYEYYSDEDIQNRVIYVEASRGCPYRCEYCLSSLDKTVRAFPLEDFLFSLGRLIDRGARKFKFVDRTFNLNVQTSRKILEFFLSRTHLDLHLHFEMVPDRLPLELREIIEKFPENSLQFEVGIQTMNPFVAANVSRRNDYNKLADNFKFLREKTFVHIHADLIVGLPGETMESFGIGFDKLVSMEPQEIQIGILKRLKGTPIVRHDCEWEMVYQSHPPYQILCNKTIHFNDMQRMVRFAKFWDLFGNSENFQGFIQVLKNCTLEGSFFSRFLDFSDFMSLRHPQGHGIALLRQVESAYVYLSEHLGLEIEQVKSILRMDYTRPKKRDIPRFLLSDC